MKKAPDISVGAFKGGVRASGTEVKYKCNQKSTRNTKSPLRRYSRGFSCFTEIKTTYAINLIQGNKKRTPTIVGVLIFANRSFHIASFRKCSK